MAQIERERCATIQPLPSAPLRPCEVFDLICGTSTGGLIALMLGRLQMVPYIPLSVDSSVNLQTIDQAIAKYENIAKTVFSKPSQAPTAMFDHTELERLVKEAITESILRLNEDAPLADETVCKTFVVSVRTHAADIPVLMRTYSIRMANAFQAKIWEAARATSAAPTFFEPVLIRGRPYGDAGIGWNNLTVEAIAEVHRIWPDRPIGCLLSIGTGLEKAKKLSDGSSESYSWLLSKLVPKTSFKLDVARYCVDCLTSCERSHHDACSKFPDRIVFDKNYFRFNVNQGLSEIGLEEWEKIGDVIDLTERYMDHGDMERKKLAVANLLLNPQSAG